MSETSRHRETVGEKVKSGVGFAIIRQSKRGLGEGFEVEMAIRGTSLSAFFVYATTGQLDITQRDEGLESLMVVSTGSFLHPSIGHQNPTMLIQLVP
jgi:hypothetical protein